MSTFARSTYQPQLSHLHFYDPTLTKQHILAKQWLESILGQVLPSNDLFLCLRDGFYLCKIMHLIQNLPTKDEYQLPEDRIQHFLNLAKDFGLQSSDLFKVDDLLNGTDMNSVISSILVLAHTSSCKRFFAGKQSVLLPPKRSQSYTTDLYHSSTDLHSQQQQDNIKRSHSETIMLATEKFIQEEKEDSLEQRQQEKEDKWDSPVDIKRPNCIPAYGPYSIDKFINEEEQHQQEQIIEQDDIYDTKKSNTNSVSGDSGYGTSSRKSLYNTMTEREKPHDLFEALFAPVIPTQTSPKPPSLRLKQTTLLGENNSKLSLLFSRKKEPHYVKFQTWSNNHQKNTSTSNTKALEEEQFVKTHVQPQESLLPPMIKIEKEHPKPPLRGRRKTDASLAPIVTKPRQRCKSVSAMDVTTDHILEHLDEEGQLLARYRLGNTIGKGHYGTVYRALDLLSGKTVAIKQIHLKDARKSDIEDMMGEAQLLSSLTHTNIVKYEGFIQTKHHMNIVLEFVENGSLLNTLKSFGNSLPEHLVASYCHHILEGLCYLHERDVVHCDLKAANILTTKAGHVKLSDFGVSLNLKLKSHEDNLVSGTPFWMSPEVIELKGASVQSDIWSLGCTVVELCTGKPPYADLITMTAMFKIVEDDCPPLPEDISENLLDFLKLCFKKDPKERPTAKMLLQHAWILEQQQDTVAMKKSNSTVVKHYLSKTIEIDDTITLDIQPPQQRISPPLPPTPPNHTASSYTTSKLAKKFNSQRATLMTRQSMPAIVTKAPHESASLPHIHSMVECSFPKGAGPCKVCQQQIKHDALVCKEFCGYICHKGCKLVNNNNVFNGTRRRASDGPKPMPSVSSQLLEKFSPFTSRKKSVLDLSLITEESLPKPTKSWWKKKRQVVD